MGRGPLWSESEIEYVLELVEQRYLARTIAQKVTRRFKVHRTRGAVHKVLKRRSVKMRDVQQRCLWQTRSCREMERLLGVSWFSVYKWIEAGALISSTRTVNGRTRVIAIGDESLFAFLANAAYWPEWSPSQITDPDIRAYAEQLRETDNGADAWIDSYTLAAQWCYTAQAVIRFARTAGIRTRRINRRTYLHTDDLGDKRPYSMRFTPQPRKVYKTDHIVVQGRALCGRALPTPDQRVGSLGPCQHCAKQQKLYQPVQSGD